MSQWPMAIDGARGEEKRRTNVNGSKRKKVMAQAEVYVSEKVGEGDEEGSATGRVPRSKIRGYPPRLGRIDLPRRRRMLEGRKGTRAAGQREVPGFVFVCPSILSI